MAMTVNNWNILEQMRVQLTEAQVVETFVAKLIAHQGEKSKIRRQNDRRRRENLNDKRIEDGKGRLNSHALDSSFVTG
jgi:hypothetical protein